MSRSTQSAAAAASARVRPHLPNDAPLAPLGAGDFCVALRQGSRVVRVARHDEAAAALAREACVLARIADRLPFPVPRPTFARPADDCAFSVHDEIAGDALTRARWRRLGRAKRDRLAADLARQLDALHAAPLDVGRRCGLPTIDAAALAARLRVDADERGVPLGPRLDAALARWADMPAPPPSLLHRDVSPPHVRFDPATGALTGLIDFGDLALGDRARDFIYIHEDFGADVLAAVVAHYAGESRATLLPRVRMWLVLEAVEWAIGLATRAGAGARAPSAARDAILADAAAELDRLELPHADPHRP